MSVIVPCRNEERYIAGCLDSILAGDYPHESLEVLVVDGRSDDRTLEILQAYAARQPLVRVLDNPRRMQAAALNIGIRAACGDVLVRMDAHVVYPKTYVAALVAALQESGADNVGGVLVTLPANQTAVGRAIALALAHPLGVGTSHFRVGVREARWVDTVAFFCCRRETFERVGGFDEDMARDEDSEFNGRLIRNGGRILLVPNVVCYYYARESLGQLARMAYQYGYSKPLVARKLGRVMTLRQLVPPGFVLALGAAAVLSPWFGAAAVALGAILGTYLAAVGAVALGAARTSGLRAAAALLLAFPALHVSYGIGFLRCALRLALSPAPRARQADMPLSR